MSNTLHVDVLPPGSPNEHSEPIDSTLAQEADKLLYADMSTRDKVWTLHFLHGWPPSKIGKALGLSRQGIHRHRDCIADELEHAASSAQVSRRRSILRERLEAQYTRAMEVKDKERSVVLALKTLEVMARLDGLNLEAQDGGQKLQPYAPPEEIAQDVRAVMLKRWNRPALESPPNA